MARRLRSLVGRMCDITTGGVGFELSRPLPLGAGATLNVQLPEPSGEAIPVRLEIAVRSCRAAAERWRIGAAIVHCSERDRRAVIAYCNVVWPYMRLRGEGGTTGAYQTSPGVEVSPGAEVRPGAEPSSGEKTVLSREPLEAMTSS